MKQVKDKTANPSGLKPQQPASGQKAVRFTLVEFLLYLVTGIIFGIVLYKAEVVSWYRIQEMFRFQSFHMHGVIGSAVVMGALIITFIKKTGMRNIYGERLSFQPKAPTVTRYLVGGIIFGFGWAMTGACPGPIYMLIGSGFTVFLIVLLSAVLGTLVYGILRSRLPH